MRTIQQAFWPGTGSCLWHSFMLLLAHCAALLHAQAAVVVAQSLRRAASCIIQPGLFEMGCAPDWAPPTCVSHHLDPLAMQLLLCAVHGGVMVCIH